MKLTNKQLKRAFKIQRMVGGKKLNWEACAMGYGMKTTMTPEQERKIK